MLSCAVLLALLVGGQGPPAARTRAEPELLDAVRLGRADRARELAAQGADVNAVDAHGLSPLMWAAALGNTELAGHLIGLGARVDARARSGESALAFAAANGHIDVVRVLLSRGADVGPAGSALSARAAARGHADTAALLGQAEVLGNALVQAVGEGQSATARQLLARGAPFNTSNADGATALMLAARNGDLGALQFLLARGADPLSRDREGNTLFDWARRSSATAPYVIAFLRDRGIPQTPPPVSSVTAGAPPVGTSLLALQRLLSNVPRSPEPLRRAHRRAADALAQLLALSANWPAESPEDYRVNLARDVRLLESALSRNATALAAAVDALADDLETKLEHCRKSGGKLGGSVKVRVRTVQDGQEARSWQVLYMPKIFEVSPTATPDLFPQLSSPTEELLVPGRYVMWARRPGSDGVGSRIVVKVGEGRPELLVDLPVPPAGSR
jgi:ankyrin repeat protein